MSKFLLLLGVSGAGKSTLIQKLLKLDNRFQYIKPDMTRPRRIGEEDKRSVTEAQMDKLIKNNTYVHVNVLFNGVRYATPYKPIIKAMAKGNFPVLDWPIQKLSIMTSKFSVYTVYVAPPSLDELKIRLNNDNRDKEGYRFREAKIELNNYWNNRFDNCINLHVVTYTDKDTMTAQIIYNSYLAVISKAN